VTHPAVEYIYKSEVTTAVHRTAQNSSADNLPFYPPNNHHYSDVVRWRGGEYDVYWKEIHLRHYYLLISSASAMEPSSDTLSPPSEGRDLCRHDDSHLAGPVRCRGDRTDETDGDDEGDETVSATVAPPRGLVQLNTVLYTHRHTYTCLAFRHRGITWSCSQCSTETIHVLCHGYM